MVKHVLLTGASRGIGRATAEILAGAGYGLILCGRDEDALMATREAVKAHDVPVRTLAFDVSDWDEVQQAVGPLLEELELYGLVNNAGVGIYKPLVQITVAEWETVVKTNLFGPFYMCKLVVPHMLERGDGRVINVTSGLAYMTMPGGNGYSASKYGLRAFTDAVRQEVAESGVKMCTVAPGIVQTDFAGRPKESKQNGLKPATVGEAIRSVLDAPRDGVLAEVILRHDRVE